MSLMGVDIGSSRCKAVLFTADGDVIAEAIESYTPRFPAPSHVEIDPDTLWSAAARAIRAAASAASDPVAAVGLSSHGETFVPVDHEGQALGPAILNTDHRAADEARWWEERLGRERIFETTGLIVHPMYPLPKLLWMRRHQPDLFASAARFVSISEYLLLKLGLPPIIAYPLACRFMAFDVRRLTWSQEILAEAGLTPDRLPLPQPAGATAGRLSPTTAADLGLPAHTPLIVAGHDQPCGALGMGAIAPGMVTDSLGTYECLVAVTDAPTLGPPSLAASLNSYCHVVPGQYITIAYFPAGIMLQWFCDTFCTPDADAAHAAGLTVFDYLEARAPDGPTGLCVLPHLIGSGNPHFDTRATGVIIGLRQNSDRPQLYRAILEGIACELDLIAETLARVVGDFHTIRCTGGGARSRLGLRLRAAIAGRRLQTLTTPEAVCLGAALLAGVSAGLYRDLPEAVAHAVNVADTVEPDPRTAHQYQPQVRQYRLLYPALAPVREAAP